LRGSADIEGVLKPILLKPLDGQAQCQFNLIIIQRNYQADVFDTTE
jgi:hypothetical protein